jgi:hypothetical protein
MIYFILILTILTYYKKRTFYIFTYKNNVPVESSKNKHKKSNKTKKNLVNKLIN